MACSPDGDVDRRSWYRQGHYIIQWDNCEAKHRPWIPNRQLYYSVQTIECLSWKQKWWCENWTGIHWHLIQAYISFRNWKPVSWCISMARGRFKAGDRCYICNDLHHWLRPSSATHMKWGWTLWQFISELDSEDQYTNESTSVFAIWSWPGKLSSWKGEKKVFNLFWGEITG